jgi:uncharacterized protein YgiM (DUF1202 family)
MQKLLLFATSLLLCISCGNNTQNSKTTAPVETAEPEISLPTVYSNAYDGYTNIREHASAQSPIIGKLPNGPEGADLLGVEGNWSKVRFNGTVGYVLCEYLQSTPTVTVNPAITAKWLEGVWSDFGGYVFYLIFSNGTYANIQQYGDMAYGTYHLEGSDIIFTHRYVTPHGAELGRKVGETERYAIDVDARKIDDYEPYGILTESELQEMLEEDMGGEMVFTKAVFDDYIKTVKSHIQ